MKLRFSVRDLLWLTLVAALLVGWAIDHFKVANTQPKLFKNNGNNVGAPIAQ